MRPALALALVALVGCAGPAPTRPGFREAWELLVCTDDGGLLDARITVGNTGALKGQGHVHVDRWRGEDSPINFTRTAGPEETAVWDERDRVAVGHDRLGVEKTGWTLRVNHAETSAVLHLDAADGPQVAEVRGDVDGGTWTISAPLPAARATGWIEAGKRGGAIEGHGLMTWRGGDGAPTWPRRSLYVLGGGDTSIGLDMHGDVRLTWARVGGRDLDASAATLRPTADGELLLDLAPTADVTVRLVPRRTGGVVDPYAHLTLAERQLLRLRGGPPVRRVQLLQAWVRAGEREERAPAVLVEVAAEDDLLPITAKKRLR